MPAQARKSKANQLTQINPIGEAAALNETLREDQDLRLTVGRLARRVERLERALQVVIAEQRHWDEIELQFLAKLGAPDLAEADEIIDRDTPQDAFDDFLRALKPEQWENMRRGE